MGQLDAVDPTARWCAADERRFAVTMAPTRDLPKLESACTTIVQARGPRERLPAGRRRLSEIAGITTSCCATCSAPCTMPRARSRRPSTRSRASERAAAPSCWSRTRPSRGQDSRRRWRDGASRRCSTGSSAPPTSPVRSSASRTPPPSSISAGARPRAVRRLGPGARRAGCRTHRLHRLPGGQRGSGRRPGRSPSPRRPHALHQSGHQPRRRRTAHALRRPRGRALPLASAARCSIPASRPGDLRAQRWRRPAESRDERSSRPASSGSATRGPSTRAAPLQPLRGGAAGARGGGPAAFTGVGRRYRLPALAW